MINFITEYDSLLLNKNKKMDVLIKINYLSNEIKVIKNIIYIYLDNSIFSIGNEIQKLKKSLINFVKLFNFTETIIIYNNLGKIYHGLNDIESIIQIINKVDCEGYNNFNKIYKTINSDKLIVFSNNIKETKETKETIFVVNNFNNFNNSNTNYLLYIKNLIKLDLGTCSVKIKCFNGTIITKNYEYSLFENLIINNFIPNYDYYFLIQIETESNKDLNDILLVELYLNNELKESTKKSFIFSNKKLINKYSFMIEDFKDLLKIKHFYKNIENITINNNYDQINKIKKEIIEIKNNIKIKNKNNNLINYINYILDILNSINLGENIKTIEKINTIKFQHFFIN
jgi:hypothetical protein